MGSAARPRSEAKANMLLTLNVGFTPLIVENRATYRGKPHIVNQTPEEGCLS